MMAVVPCFQWQEVVRRAILKAFNEDGSITFEFLKSFLF